MGTRQITKGEEEEEASACSRRLYLTVSVVDRYVQAERVDRAKLQLVGVSAMCLRRCTLGMWMTLCV